jgi:hypothetical protein
VFSFLLIFLFFVVRSNPKGFVTYYARVKVPFLRVEIPRVEIPTLLLRVEIPRVEIPI